MKMATFQLLGALIGILGLFSPLSQPVCGQGFGLPDVLPGDDSDDSGVNFQDFLEIISGLNITRLLSGAPLDKEVCTQGILDCTQDQVKNALFTTATGNAAFCGWLEEYTDCLFGIDGCLLSTVSGTLNILLQPQLEKRGITCENIISENGQGSLNTGGSQGSGTANDQGSGQGNGLGSNQGNGQGSNQGSGQGSNQGNGQGSIQVFGGAGFMLLLTLSLLCAVSAIVSPF